jgi:Uma2 family endonuclease
MVQGVIAEIDKLQALEIPEGGRICLGSIDWSQFETILAELGNHRGSRIAYSQGILEIRMPLPEHERVKVLIAHLLVVLLEELGLEWESLGSTTFKRKTMLAGLEPDDCFYIENYPAVMGKKRLDLEVDPVPDLAIEVDLTSITQISAYQALGIPEVWCYRSGTLTINLLKKGQYQESLHSDLFPNFPIIEGFSRFLTQSPELPMSALRREFRAWVKHRI